MPYYCSGCAGRLVYCPWCKWKHCTCRPHVARAGRVITRSHVRKIVTIRKQSGETRFMSSRRYAHLKGAQRGGQTTATRPNPGRFDSEAGRKAIRRRWDVIRKVNKPTGLRLGLPSRKKAPGVDRVALRALYAKTPRLGICFDARWGLWRAYEVRQTVNGPQQMYGRIISEQTALRRLGHVAYVRKNWVPEENEPIIATSVGMTSAERQSRRKKR